MEDERILALFFDRDEQAVVQTKQKYGTFCYGIAWQLLQNREDALECENDVYFCAWNTIPPQRPKYFKAFLGKITRNLALNRLRAAKAGKRGGEEVALSLEELGQCISPGCSFDERLQAQELADYLTDFLRSLPRQQRQVFVCRYWYCDSISQISTDFGFSQSKVKMMLLRIRKQLMTYLVEKEVFV